MFWLIAVGFLLVRQTVFVMVNLTTYEFVKRPMYVRRRFPNAHSIMQFLSFWKPHDCIQSCIGYWTLDPSLDSTDFIPTPGGSPLSSPRTLDALPADDAAQGQEEEA